MKPTYEELERELLSTKKLLRAALEEIAKLKEQLRCNSKNSSKPPSTDQKGNTSKKQKKSREPRVGKSRIPFPPERIDKYVECSRENCSHCGSLAIQWNEQPSELFQQAELPEVRKLDKIKFRFQPDLA